MKYCTNCGTAIDANAEFCTRCGAKQNSDNVVYKTQVETNQGVNFETKREVNQEVSKEGESLNIFALSGVILGAISWFINLFGLIGIAAVVFSILAINQGLTGKNKVIAIIGLVSGIVNVLYAAIYLMALQ